MRVPESVISLSSETILRYLSAVSMFIIALYVYDLCLHLIYYMWVCSFNLKLFHKRQMPSEICRQNFIFHCSWCYWYSPLQVCLDVHRCNSRIPKDSSPSQAAAIKSRLRNVIIKSLAEAPSRYYYQVWRHYFVTIVVMYCAVTTCQSLL